MSGNNSSGQTVKHGLIGEQTHIVIEVSEDSCSHINAKPVSVIHECPDCGCIWVTPYDSSSTTVKKKLNPMEQAIERMKNRT